jgi:hypothetical protein
MTAVKALKMNVSELGKRGPTKTMKVKKSELQLKEAEASGSGGQ